MAAASLSLRSFAASHFVRRKRITSPSVATDMVRTSIWAYTMIVHRRQLSCEGYLGVATARNLNEVDGGNGIAAHKVIRGT